MKAPLTVSGAVRNGDVASAAPVLRRSENDLRSRELFDPPAGGLAEQTAERMENAGPLGAGAIVAGIGYVVLTVFMISAGLVLTKLVLDGWLGARDADVNQWFEARRSVTWDDWSRLGSTVADTLSVIAVAALIALVLACRKCWREISFLAIALFLEVTVFVSTTFLVDRERPPVVQLDEAPPTSSFPSGHTAASLVLYLGFALIIGSRIHNRARRVAVYIIASLAPLCVALSRVYRGMHFPSDVVAGAALGVACLAVALFAVRVAVAVSQRKEIAT
jgi:membrane-associated phospholipid phosphatase